MQNLENKIRRTWLAFLMLAMAFFSLPSFAVTSTEAFNKGRAKISGAKSLSADFTTKINGQSVSGSIGSKGSKFYVKTNGASSWYNGKDLYTYNSAAGETSLFNPTTAELAEINPLYYIKNVADYDIKESKSKKSNRHAVVLTPKQKNKSGVKSVIIELDAATYLPSEITVIPKSGGTLKISVANIKLNPSLSDSLFEYPKAKYPRVKINDMR